MNRSHAAIDHQVRLGRRFLRMQASWLVQGLGILALVGGTLACGKARMLHAKAFETRASAEGLAKPDLVLASARGIQYRAVYDRSASGHRQVKIEFPHLTASDFSRLRAAYHGEDTVPYEPQRAYEIIDFLPGIVQATVGLGFERRILRAEYPQLTSATNCWGTAYEFLRADADGFFSFEAPAERAGPFFFDDSFSALIKELDENLLTSTTADRNEGLQFGDVLTIYFGVVDEVDARHFSHAAIYLDQDLYFEKTGYASSDVYRLATLADILSSYPPANHHLVFRRFRKKELPRPDLAFALPGHVHAHFIEDARVNGSGIIESSFSLVDKQKYFVDPKSGRFALAPAETQRASLTVPHKD